MRTTTLALAGLAGVSGHGWVTKPVSKNEMAYHHYVTGMPDDFHYEPQTSNHGNGIGQKLQAGGAACGANDAGYTKGLSMWQTFYDKAGIAVPKITPGGVLGVNVWRQNNMN